MNCADFLEFQDYLKKSREMDDKIMYFLNTSLPTDSFQGKLDLSGRCKDLYSQLETNYRTRESSIRQCISIATDSVKELRTNHNINPDDTSISKSLKREQTKIRLLQTELGVEEIVKSRSVKLFYERCRNFYKPDNLTL